MPRHTVDFKFYGELAGLSPETAARLALTLPDDAAIWDGNRLNLEYEGFEAALEDFLEEIKSLPAQAQGHLDVIDNYNQRVSRYAFSGNSIHCESFGFDDILEHTKNEGNF